jgi:hypothetical protein
LGHRLMGRASRPEAVAVLGKRRVPLLLENLQQRLLDQSVDDTRDAELTDPAVRLGYFDPLDRLRLVGSREQLRPNTWPVILGQCSRKVTTHPRLLRQNGIASYTADCGSQGARGRAQGDRAVPLRLGRGNVATHFVGSGIRSHRFSLTDGDSSDSALGCIKMSSPSYPKKS